MDEKLQEQVQQQTTSGALDTSTASTTPSEPAAPVKKRGRPTKYHTEQERKEADVKRHQKLRQSIKDEVRAMGVKVYDDDRGRPRMMLTPQEKEERRQARLKASRDWKRRKRRAKLIEEAKADWKRRGFSGEPPIIPSDEVPPRTHQVIYDRPGPCLGRPRRKEEPC